MADVMTPAQRSAFMSKIRPKDTGLELRVFAALVSAGLRFGRHMTVLPRCTPDIVFSTSKAVVLVHGDFWHGWRFPLWEGKLAPFWREKIAINRARDRRNYARLRRHGWSVLRVWEHDLRSNFEGAIQRIVQFARLHESS
jgi:DNA mismatch endonuclease (patch repair protein)